MDRDFILARTAVLNNAVVCLIVAALIVAVVLLLIRHYRRLASDDESDQWSLENWLVACLIVGGIGAIVVTILCVCVIDGFLNTELRARQTVWEMQNPVVRVKSQ